MFGPPGAGKGTQAYFIVKNFNLHKVSTGDLLRSEINKKTELGNKIKSIINKGSLAPDNIINKLIDNILINKNFSNRVLFDGYPRNLDQVKNLESLLKKNNQKIAAVISLEVDKESIVKRILGRQTCSNCGKIFNEYFYPSTSTNHTCDSTFLQKRSDDNKKTIISRYDIYLEKTLPILNFYKKKKLLHQINGMSKVDQIYSEIRDIIASLGT